MYQFSQNIKPRISLGYLYAMCHCRLPSAFLFRTEFTLKINGDDKVIDTNENNRNEAAMCYYASFGFSFVWICVVILII